MARGNKGFFFGAPLQLLQKHLLDYLALQQKEFFWKTFWPEWDDTYPELDTDKLQQELADEEKAFQEETAHVDKHRICPPMKSSLFRVFMTRHVLGYTPEGSVLRFPSSWRGWNH
ncbi:hypothetical protein B0H14DRAFT_2637705 [Mycena olivaceomarginata]|nr:hypothetical protein B0H14DRAFT_2637695 [Mycena olivaceomarginata]KAJ7742104.1 hypothetical protein B0H14DRAFT_2637705 [Mycena olivaceomarginata]